MKQSFSGRRLGAAAALTAVTLVGGGLAMAPTASASTAAAAPVKLAAPVLAGAPGSQVTPNASLSGCQSALQNYGYDVTRARNAICIATVAIAVVNSQKAFSYCYPAMKLTGVGWVAALVACGQASNG
jgi:hypothetical protein